VTREQIHARPGQPWPIGSFCLVDIDEHGQSWISVPRCTCEACGRVWALPCHVPKKVPACCPKCKAPVESIQESEAV